MELQIAQKAVIYDEGQVLMVRKSADDPFNPFKWELPGGRLKIGESLEDHIRREVKEEVGLDITVGPPLAMWQWTMGSPGTEKTVVAVSRYCQPTDRNVSFAGHDSGDFIETSRWVAIADVEGMDLIPNARAAIVESLEVLHHYLSAAI